MSITPYNVQAYRDGKWQEVMSSDLVPGDVVSVCKSPHTGLRIRKTLIVQYEPHLTLVSHVISSSYVEPVSSMRPCFLESRHRC